MATGSSTPENITIPYGLYCALYLYFCSDAEIRNIPTVETYIQTALEERQERLDRRNAFSDYRNETDESRKQKLLADYLEKVGIPADFRQDPQQDGREPAQQP